MKPLLTLALGGVFLAGFAAADGTQSGDPEAGRKIAGQCRTCHGLDGFAKIPIAPHIGGEPESYLVTQLTAFRDGAREHEMMSVVTRMLSDQQIADVSAWYASHVATVTLTASEDDAPEQCSACHGPNGLAIVEDAPHLAGETNIYIETQLKAYRTGKRQHDIMSEIVAEMSDDDIRAVANWFAAIKLRIDPPQ